MEQLPLLGSIPAIYRNIFPSFFDSLVLPEVFATCANCAMTQNTVPTGAKFSKVTKCCTYYPSLPNYLVGAILLDKDGVPEGVRRIESAISSKTTVSPVGIFPSRKYLALYFKSSSATFGRSESLMCPYFEQPTGLCTIWKHRESVCSTYFCKHVAGKTGSAFWGSFKQYMNYSQTSLVKHVLLTLNVPRAGSVVSHYFSNDYAHGNLSLADVEDEFNEGRYRSMWGEWFGREREFYIRCFEIVSSLSKQQFENILGVDEKYKLLDVAEKHANVSNIPAVLAKTPILHRKTADMENYVVIVPQSQIEVLIPIPLLDAFDGVKETSVIIEEVRALNGIDADPDVVLLLYHGGVLCAAENALK